MKRASKIFTAIFVSLASLSGCTTMDLISEAATTAMTFGRQLSEQRSFLATSTVIFYPDGVPGDIEELPALSQDSLDRITKDLENQSAILLRALHANTELLSKVFARRLSNVERQRVRLLNSGQTVALVARNGDIEIDVRVIQAIYRGVLLGSVLNDNESIDAAALKVRQKQALAELLRDRTRFLNSIPNPTVGAIDAGVKAIAGTGLSFQSAFAVMESRALDLFSMDSSVDASERYDDAIGFVVAHEIAHRALQHYDLFQSGARLQDLELEADRLAALLVVLARNQKVYPNDDYVLFGAPPGKSVLISYDFLGEPERICLLDLNYTPKGHVSFFRYGYSFSGFDSLGKGSASSVSSAVRLSMASSVSSAAMWAIEEAQSDTGTCRNSSEKLQEFARDPVGNISKRLEETKKKVESLRDKDAELSSYEQDELQKLTLISNEPEVAAEVYVTYFEQLKR